MAEVSFIPSPKTSRAASAEYSPTFLDGAARSLYHAVQQPNADADTMRGMADTSLSSRWATGQDQIEPQNAGRAWR
ncbi:hypothetical protein CSPX01_08867 [Colletotrichum filicis]|nr:hypothetical protein CSPX01_08867 [Colletotrichum filicis]